MVTFYLINQPESTWMKEERIEGDSDTSLTKRGKAIATSIGRYYAKRQIDGIISSRLHRAVQCSKILAQFIPCQIVREQALNDMSLGVWQGKFPEEVEARYPEVWHQWKNDPAQTQIPGGESLTDTKENLKAVLQKYSENSLFPQYYLVSTHDIIVRILLSIIENEPLEKIWKYQLNPGSVSEVSIYPKSKVVSINTKDYENV